MFERKVSYSLLAMEEGELERASFASATVGGSTAATPRTLTPLPADDHKFDGRLYPEYPLYCEGLHKPCGRGYLHLICTILLPFGFYHFSVESNGNSTAMWCSYFYLFTNLWCYGFSGVYHTGKWSVGTEILLQKLDHCGIAMLSCGTFVPVAVLLLQPEYGALLILSTGIACLWACWNIIYGRPSVMRQAMVPACFLPFLPLAYTLMTPFEFTCTMSCIMLQVAGMAVFVYEKPNPLPSHFGYHELFHLLCTMAGVAVYLCNWSVVHRMCNAGLNGESTDIYDLYFRPSAEPLLNVAAINGYE